MKTRPNVKFSLYLKKASLASRNMVHLQKNHPKLCRFLIFSTLCGDSNRGKKQPGVVWRGPNFQDSNIVLMWNLFFLLCKGRDSRKIPSFTLSSRKDTLLRMGLISHTLYIVSFVYSLLWVNWFAFTKFSSASSLQLIQVLCIVWFFWITQLMTYSQTYSRRRYYRWVSDALSKSLFYFQTVKKAKVTTEMQLCSDMHARGLFINLFSFLIEVVFTTFKNLKRLGDLSNTKKTRTASINPVMTCNS